MLEISATYLQLCSMRPKDAANVGKMILSRFPQIGLTINPSRETYPPLLTQKIPEGEVLVIFEIPRRGIFMPDFYLEFCNTLNQESSTMSHGEKKR